MALIYWWILLIGILVTGVLVVLYKKKLLKRFLPNSRFVRVAHSERITMLPEYQQAKKQYRRLITGLFIVFCFSIIVSLFLASRPATESLVTPAEKNRDIMLCLDISGSMSAVDTKLVSTFEQLARDFQGQRIGLDIFNFNSSQVFPLTDDYSLIQEQLAYVKKILSLDRSKLDFSDGGTATEYYNFLSGTSGTGMKLANISNDGFPSSNAGLGLSGCVKHLGDNQTNRSQSILLATDNELYGDPANAVITTSQAMMLAKQKGIRVYAIDPGAYNESTEQSDASIADDYKGSHAVLKNYAILTSGGYYRLSSVDIVPDVIAQIAKQEAKLFVGDSQYAASDTPLLGFIALYAGFVVMLGIFWRLKL